MKSNKRALELEEAEARVAQIRYEMAAERARASAYLVQELEHYLKRLFKEVTRVRSERECVCVVFGGRNMELRVATKNGWSKEKSQILYGEVPFVTLNNNGYTCDLLRVTDIPIAHLLIFAEVFPDALHIAQHIVPAWRANPPDAIMLMTTRVIRWIAQQVGGQWPDIVAGHVVTVIEQNEK
jgi:hypothetical protein